MCTLKISPLWGEIQFFMILFIYLLFTEYLLGTNSLCMCVLSDVELALFPVHNHTMYMGITIFNHHDNHTEKTHHPIFQRRRCRGVKCRRQSWGVGPPLTLPLRSFAECPLLLFLSDTTFSSYFPG